MKNILIKIATHVVAALVGVALGIYLLPILTEPESPDAAILERDSRDATYQVELTRDLRGSDFLHWGKAKSASLQQRSFTGRLAPGPDYKLYLVNEFVEHEEEFLPIKDSARLVGDVKMFSGFVLDIPEGINPDEYSTVLVWCEAFSEFITAGQYN